MDKLSTRNTTSVSFEMKFNIRYNNLRSQKSIIIMLLPMYRNSFVIVWQKKQYWTTLATSILPRHGSMQLLAFSQAQNTIQRKGSWRHWRNQDQCNKTTYDDSQKWLWKLFSAVEALLTNVCYLRRGTTLKDQGFQLNINIKGTFIWEG